LIQVFGVSLPEVLPFLCCRGRCCKVNAVFSGIVIATVIVTVIATVIATVIVTILATVIAAFRDLISVYSSGVSLAMDRTGSGALENRGG
jgi:hypothetical protein